MRKTLFIIAILGILISGYLSYAYLNDAHVICGEYSGCSAVQYSKYADVFGVPVAIFGVLFYVALALATILNEENKVRSIKSPLAILTGAGLMVSIYLTYIEAFVLHAWCYWCVASAILSITAFILVWYKLISYENN